MMAAVSVGVLDVLSDGHTGVAHSLAVAILIGNLVAFVLFTGFVVLLTADVCEGRAVRPVGELIRASAAAFFPLLLAGVVVLERPGRLRALRMSRRLVRGNGWRVFALIALLGLPLALVFSGVDAVAATAGNGPSIAVRILVATLILPIPVLAAVALYFELRRGAMTPVHQTTGVGPPTIGPQTSGEGAPQAA